MMQFPTSVSTQELNRLFVDKRADSILADLALNGWYPDAEEEDLIFNLVRFYNGMFGHE